MFSLTFNELENFRRVEIFTFFDFRRIEMLPFVVLIEFIEFKFKI